MEANTDNLDNPLDNHFIHRSNWLKAVVLGANDGILSTASIAMGVAAGSDTRDFIILATLAGLAAGALSMTASHFVSVSSQTDIEKADIEREKIEMNYLDASIRGIKFQKGKIPNSKKEKYDASIGELNPKRLKLNIPTLSPKIFRKNYIKNNMDELLSDDSITQFFIHSFKDDDVYLNLPLPPHKKTVNDFVFISDGSMTKNLGIESFQLKKNDFLFTPKNNINTTESVSADLEGFYCHFTIEFIGPNPFMGTLHTQPSSQNYLHISEIVLFLAQNYQKRNLTNAH